MVEEEKAQLGGLICVSSVIDVVADPARGLIRTVIEVGLLATETRAGPSERTLGGPIRTPRQEGSSSRVFRQPREARRKDTAVASMSDDSSRQESGSSNSWTSQLLAAVWRALFEERWTPWVRLILTAVVFAAL